MTTMNIPKQSLYTIKVISTFDSAHQLLGYDGPCARVHGHTYTLEVEIQGGKLNHLGMLIDCYDVKKHLKLIVDQIDHYHLNDLEPFKTVNPTAENIATWIFEQISEKLNTDNLRVNAVTLWETERFSVRYEEL
jgi:6-pyruvoyltetrahydropterin/6-carboxytetrahydropterin synthase